MDKLRAEGFKLDLLFVFADEETMVDRAKRRAKTTGRITKPDHVCSSISPPAPASWRADPGPSQIKSSRMKSPLVVRALGRKDIVDRVRLVDNSIDSEPPKIVYDSEQDENWKQGGQVDVDLFMSLRSR